MTQILDGKTISTQVKEEIANHVRRRLDAGKNAPHLAAILVGNDPASETYVAAKERACKEVGFLSSLYKMDPKTTEEELLNMVDFLNKDPEINGYIVQLPLPKHIDADKVLLAIDPKKDVDGFHPINLGRMVTGQTCFLPATPYGVMEILERSGVVTEGKDIVVLGRSNIVGTPLSILLSRNKKNANGTVTLCHSKTKDLADKCRQADILIAAIGKAEFITADMVKEGAVVIDVGIHRITDEKSEKGYRIVGDVKYDEVAKKASAITPVPGGVGPMTIVALLKNTLIAAEGLEK